MSTRRNMGFVHTGQRLQRTARGAPPPPARPQDNGMGMSHKDIPDMLGRVLSGTKYGVKQTRGKFGLGAKMALIWSKMSTGLPIEVASARRGAASRSYFKLDLDIQRWVGGWVVVGPGGGAGGLDAGCGAEEGRVVGIQWWSGMAAWSAAARGEGPPLLTTRLQPPQAEPGHAAASSAALCNPMRRIHLVRHAEGRNAFPARCNIRQPWVERACVRPPAGTSPTCTRASCWTTATAGTARSSAW